MTVIDPSILHLEVETPTTGLVNLVQNPNGDGGAWNWVTPVPGATLTGGTCLTYTNEPGVASYFYTEALPVTAGNYIAAYWQVLAGGTANYYRARFEFLDATQAVLSQGTQTAYTAVAGQPDSSLIIAATVIPSSTIYARLRFDLYFDTSGTNPGGASTFPFLNVTVAQASTSAALQTQRTNLVTNPSFETNTVGWTATLGAISRTASQHYVGSASLALALAGSGGQCQTDMMPVTAGKAYYASAQAMSTYTATGLLYLSLWWYDASGNQIGAVSVPGGGAANAWLPMSVGDTAPSGATQARILIGASGSSGQTVYVDAVMLEQTDAAGAYFDGATSPDTGWTPSWTGTANASTSKATLSQLLYIPPITYLDVLGDVHTLTIDRPEFDVGTLTANIVNSALDPAVVDTLASGLRCRVRAAGLDAPLFTGRVSDVQVAYDFTQSKDAKRANITLTATDAMTPLTQASRSYGVGTIAELPYVLEGAGVPWNCNGSGNQVPTATIQSYNDQASAADQIVITRDSVMGYAWIDTNGVLQAWDRDQISSTVAATLTETDYNDDIVIDFDTERVIDSVAIQLMTYDDANGASEQTNLGPYVAAGTLGQHQQTFTVNGLTEAQCATLAADILAANGTPTRTVQSLTVTMTAENMADFAGLDHYDLVHITNTRAGMDDNHRVIGVNHEIDAVIASGNLQVQWVLTLNFTSDGTVAPPQLLPDPTVTQLTNVPSSVAYDPAWSSTGTAPDVGNGTLVGRYHLSDGWCDFLIQLTWGSTTNGGSGTWLFNLPIDPGDYQWFFSEGEAYDNTAVTDYFAGLKLRGVTGSVVAARTLAASGPAFTNIDAATPFTWASGDVLAVAGRYQVG